MLDVKWAWAWCIFLFFEMNFSKSSLPRLCTNTWNTPDMCRLLDWWIFSYFSKWIFKTTGEMNMEIACLIDCFSVNLSYPWNIIQLAHADLMSSLDPSNIEINRPSFKNFLIEFAFRNVKKYFTRIWRQRSDFTNTLVESDVRRVILHLTLLLNRKIIWLCRSHSRFYFENFSMKLN